MFPTIKLTSDDISSRVEAIRLAFYIGGVPFEDKRVSYKQFNAMKDSLPLGQLPMLEVEGEVVTQTPAILRYAGRLGGLYPINSPLAGLKVDEVLNALCEMEEQLTPFLQEKDSNTRKDLREEFVTDTLPRYAALLESRLEKMQQLTLFQSDSVCERNRDLRVDEVYQTSAIFAKVASNSKVKEWYNLPHGLPKLNLIYFPFPGRAEPIRLAFFIGGVDFEDVRVSFQLEEFKKVKAELPFNQLPVLEVDGETISQSTAILRYAGSVTDLYPTTDLLAACRVDELFVLIDEMYNSPAWRETIRELDPQRLMKMREGLSQGLIFKTLDSLDKRVAQFKGPYATGENFTVADLAIYTLVAGMKAGRPGIPTTITNPFLNLLRIFALVETHPKVVEWNATHM